MEQYKDFPEEIQKIIKFRVEEQGNTYDFNVDYHMCAKQGGFTWNETPEGHGFWADILNDKNFDKFYEKYSSTNINSQDIEIGDTVKIVKKDNLCFGKTFVIQNFKGTSTDYTDRLAEFNLGKDVIIINNNEFHTNWKREDLKIIKKGNSSSFKVGDEIEFLSSSNVVPDWIVTRDLDKNHPLYKYIILDGNTALKENLGIVKGVWDNDHTLISFFDINDIEACLVFNNKKLKLKSYNDGKIITTDHTKCTCELSSGIATISVGETPVGIALCGATEKIPMGCEYR